MEKGKMEGKMEGKLEKWKKEEGKKKRKEGKYPYFVFLFNVCSYDRQKSQQKKGKIFKHFKGGEGTDFFGWP